MPENIEPGLDWTPLSMQLANGQLAFMVGAGLSMTGKAPLPAAAALLENCVDRMQREFGEAPPADKCSSLEALCDYLHDIDQLQRLFIHRVVPWGDFKSGAPNTGHLAIADFLLSRRTSAVICTNYDTRIETAAHELGENDFSSSVSAAELAPRNHSTFLKIHGCAIRDEQTTVWCPSQLDDQPIAQRIEASKQLVPGWLANKDLVILGFWSDWPHLYDSVCNILAQAEPSTVYVVNPSTSAELSEKAPELWAWAQERNFVHVEMGAEEFLKEMWTRYGINALRRAFALSADVYTDAFGVQPPDLEGYAEWPRDPLELRGLRADLCGSPRGFPVHDDDLATDTSLLAAAVFRHIIDTGAAIEHDALMYGGHRLRVIGYGGLMSSIKARYQQEPPANQAETIMVCPGAIDDGGAPTNIVRGETPGDVVRGAVEGNWISLQQWQDLSSDEQ